METSSTSNFSRFVGRFLLPWLAFTVAFALVLDTVTARVLIPRGPTGRIQRLLDESSNEVGIFGTSRAEGNYVPTSLGSAVFDYGFSGTGFDVTRALLEIELAKTKRSPVIVNFDFDFFRHGIGDPKSYVPYYQLPVFESLMARAGANHWYYRVPGIRFFGSYQTYLNGFLASSLSNPAKAFVRGASLNRNVMPRERFLELVKTRLTQQDEFIVPPEEDAAFQALLSERADRRIIIVVSPYHRSVYESLGDVTRLQDYLTHLEQTHPNVTALFFDGRDMGDDLFFDTTHLNEKGAYQFSSDLRGHLQQRGIAL